MQRFSSLSFPQKRLLSASSPSMLTATSPAIVTSRQRIFSSLLKKLFSSSSSSSPPHVTVVAPDDTNTYAKPPTPDVFFAEDDAEVKRQRSAAIANLAKDDQNSKVRAPPTPATAQALVAACVDGRLDDVKDLVGRGAPANIAPNANGYTALHAACAVGNVEIVKFLLSSNMNNNNSSSSKLSPLLSASKANVTPLHVACAANKPEIVELLCRTVVVDMKLPPKTKNPDGKIHAAVDVRANAEGVTPLHLAVKFGSTEAVQSLLNAGANPTLFTNEPEPQSPISVACLRGDLELLKLLFAHAIKIPGMSEKSVVNLTSPVSGATPLQIAAGAGQLDVVQFLVEECDADPRFFSKELCPHPPIYLAAYGGHANVVRYFLESSSCKIGADEQLVADGGVSPLHVACKSGSVETVALLLEHGADRWLAQKETKIVPLHIACLHGHLDVVKLLIPLQQISNKSSSGTTTAATADDNNNDNNNLQSRLPLREAMGYTCLHLALVGGHTDVFAHLLRRGFASAELSVRADRRGTLPLHVAAEAGNVRAVELILEQFKTIFESSDSNSPSPSSGGGNQRQQHQPLSAAELDGSNRQADSKYSQMINARDVHGVTALHAAAYSGSLPCVELLIKAGADSAIADTKGETAILIAKNEKHYKIMEYLQNHAMGTQGRLPS